MKDKIKVFIKKHEKEVKIVTAIGLVAIGYGVCYKLNGLKRGCVIVTDESMCDVFRNHMNKYGNCKTPFYTDIMEEPIKVDELVDRMKNTVGYDDSFRVSHIIAIGPGVKER